jgi:hypothetical protein
MPIGPRGQRRPAEIIDPAIMVARSATGEISESAVPKSGRIRNDGASGRPRAENLTARERKTIDRKAAADRCRDNGQS